MNAPLLAARILSASKAVIGPTTRAERAALLAAHDEFRGLSMAEVLDLADHQP